MSIKTKIIIPFIFLATIITIGLIFNRTTKHPEITEKFLPTDQLAPEENLPCKFIGVSQAKNTPCWTLKLDLFAEGLEKPVFLTSARDASGRMFVVLKSGVIQIIKNHAIIDPPFLDIKSKVNTTGHEQGLLSVAFHPEFTKNGFFYISYTDANNNLNVSRYTTKQENPNVADLQTEKNILVISKKTDDHNGGQLVFGPEGLLYIGVGDDANLLNAQNKKTLNGKILRIDVNSEGPYSIPKDNPFIFGWFRPEIYAFGLRNPWSFTIDKKSNNFYIADVGEKRYEEINIVTSNKLKNSNFGWPYFEGFSDTKLLYKNNKDKSAWFSSEHLPPRDSGDIIMPSFAYHHVKKTEKEEFIDSEEDDDNACTGAIIGGKIYRGKESPQMKGYYFFADYCTGIIRALFQHKEKYESTTMATDVYQITSFGEDEEGEIYVINSKGILYKLVAAQSTK